MDIENKPLLNSSEAFWKNKKVLITGHTGFKGSWLALFLMRLGAEVIGIALPPSSSPNNFSLLNLENHMISVFGDIRDHVTISQVIHTYQPEIILHLAAQSLVRYSYEEPIETYGTNVMGTVNLLEAARKFGQVRAIVNVTTDKCYENKEWQWGYRETDRLGGSDPYSNSKACSELITCAYRDSFFNPKHYNNPGTAIATARAGNVIGGGDWAKDRLVPDIICSNIKNDSVVIRNPYAVRPWQHVFDPLYGYLLLAEKLYNGSLEFGEAWNFGPSENDIKPVIWIVNFINSMWNKSCGWKLEETEQPHETQQLRLDCSKSRNVLKWFPQWNLESALMETVYWYQAYYSHQEMHEYSIAQLNRYLANFHMPTSTKLINFETVTKPEQIELS